MYRTSPITLFFFQNGAKTQDNYVCNLSLLWRIVRNQVEINLQETRKNDIESEKYDVCDPASFKMARRCSFSTIINQTEKRRN